MHYGGEEVDQETSCCRDMPSFIKRLQVVAGDPVVSTTFFHETVDAMIKCISRCNVDNGGGGACTDTT